MKEETLKKISLIKSGKIVLESYAKTVKVAKAWIIVQLETFSTFSKNITKDDRAFIISNLEINAENSLTKLPEKYTYKIEDYIPKDKENKKKVEEDEYAPTSNRRKNSTT